MCSIIFLPINQSLSQYLEEKNKSITPSQYHKIYEDKYSRTNIIKRKNARQKKCLCVWALM